MVICDMRKPKYLFRDDGQRFTLQSNGKYTMDESAMEPKYEYSFEILASYGFTETKPKPAIIPHQYEGCGYAD